MEDTRQRLKDFAALNSEYEKYIKKYLRNKNLSHEEKDSAEAELRFITEEKEMLQISYDTAKENKLIVKKRFEKEATAPENPKLVGQPLHTKIEDILCQLGLN